MKKIFVFCGVILFGQLAYSATVNDVTVMGKVVTNEMHVSTVGKVASLWFLDGSTFATSNLDAIRSTITAIQQSTSSIETTLSQRTLTFSEEGGPGANNVTKVNCVGSVLTCSQANSTVTLTVSVSPQLRTFTVIVGTAGAVGVDYASNNLRQVTNQIYSDFGIGGASTNSIPLTIWFRDGVYGASDSTCPVLVKWMASGASSGTIFAIEDDSKTITNNYGTQDGFVYDGGGRAFKSQLIRMKSNSVLKNFTIIGGQGIANGPGTAAHIYVLNSTNVLISDGWFKEFKGCASPAYNGGCAALKIETSTRTLVTRVRFSSPSVMGSIYEATVADHVRTKYTHLSDNVFEGINSMVIVTGSGVDKFFTDNTFIFGAGSQGDGANYGSILLDGGDETPEVAIASVTVFANNRFVFVSTGGAVGAIFRSRQHPSFSAAGYKIINNVVSSPVRTNWKFYNHAGGTVFNTIITNNMVDNLEIFYQATGGGGAGDKYQSLGNMFNGIEQ